MTNNLRHFLPFRLDLENKVGSYNGYGYSIKRGSDRFGKNNRAMRFYNNGGIDKVALNRGVIRGMSAFTVTFWVKVENFTSELCFFSVASTRYFNEVVLGKDIFHL